MEPVKSFDEHFSELLSDPKAKELYNQWELAVELSKKLQDRRKELGITQRKLANMLDIPQQSISKVERLTGGVPKIATLIRIADKLGLALDIQVREKQSALKSNVSGWVMNQYLDGLWTQVASRTEEKTEEKMDAFVEVRV